MSVLRRILKALAVLAVLGGVIGWMVLGPCTKALLFWGVRTHACPDGTPRVKVDVSAEHLVRGEAGELSIDAYVDFVDPSWGERTSRNLGRFDAEIRLGDRTLPCELEERWTGHRFCELTLPADLPDGDHVLEVLVTTPLEDVTVDLELPVYRPARVHVLTDRPLYEGGQTVQFRALVLAADGLVPLADRPGRWKVWDPHGRLVLDEDAVSGPWGVSDSTFPLAAAPVEGTWRVEYVTGSDTSTATVQVRPFELPAFTVEAVSDEPWYAPGDEVVLSGVARYTSGAPVGDATVRARWWTSDGWPPPRAWSEPQELVTDAAGAFELALGTVPDDLQGRVTMRASLEVTDAAGDTVTGGGRAVLSEDPLDVEAVTELSGGLVSGYPNRVYLRATTPDGRALADETLTVKRAWDPRDTGTTAMTDASGVAELVLDPGEPVTVVIPPPPYRPPPPSKTRSFELGATSELVAGRQLEVQERRRLMELTLGLHERCGELVRQTTQLEALLSVRGGRISEVHGEDDLVGRCLASVLEGAPLGPTRREIQARWSVRVQELPRVELRRSFGHAHVTRDALLQDAATEATACVAPGAAAVRELGELSATTTLPWALKVTTRAGSARLDAELIGRDGRPADPCLARSFAGLTLDEPELDDRVAVYELRARPASKAGEARQQATTRPGYELLVGAADVGETTLRLWPGTVPALRLRPSKVVLEPGERFEVQLLRGPGFSGMLPETLELVQAGRVLEELERPDQSSKVEVPLPAGTSGFFTVRGGGASAVVYVEPPARLELALAWDGEGRPGAEGAIEVQASGEAVVSLVGVDETLGELVPLTADDELSEQLVTASSSDPAFGSLDAAALAMGAIAGEQATRAAVLRVDHVSDESVEAPPLYVEASSTYAPEAEIFEAFFPLFAEVRQAVRAWEASAPADELLTNEHVEGMWNEAVREGDVRDPWDRPLALATLPESLLRRLDPRRLASDATRLPEDVVDWLGWARWRTP